MSLTTNVPILPGFAPGRSTNLPVYPVRGPNWSIKATSKWNNVRQQSVGGRITVVKYWSAPLWEWEWAYDVILDNPSSQNPLYTTPIPYTDFQILSGFFNDRQGGGNEFAFQPPDSVVGGTFSIIKVSGSSNLWTLYVANNTIQAGLYACFSGLTVATFLNTQNPIQVLVSTPTYIVVYFSHAGTINLQSETGSVFAGQLLAAEDPTNSTQLIHQTGGYPIFPLSGTPISTTQITEPVQIIDSASLVMTWGTGASIPSGNITIQPADSIPGYPGLVVTTSIGYTPPILASFNYYYLCRFTEDSQDYENFMAMLWSCGAFKFEQVRI